MAWLTDSQNCSPTLNDSVFLYVAICANGDSPVMGEDLAKRVQDRA